MSEIANWPSGGDCRQSVGRVVLSRRQIRRRLRSLAAEITGTYDGEVLTVLAVLTGAVVFLADLIRYLPMPLRLRFVAIQSYPGQATQSNGCPMLSDIPGDLQGCDVLIVDDILDSGNTLSALTDKIVARGARSARRCVLLRKSRPDLPDRLQADFVGFDIGDEFVVGYGLDFDSLYRNLPDIRVLERHEGAMR